MHSYECPLCNSTMPVMSTTRSAFFISFDTAAKYTSATPDFNCPDPFIAVSLFKCPSCKKLSIYAVGKNSYLNNVTTNIYPQARHKNYPEYIPQTIRNYYEEAFATLEASHRSSYCLSRTCLQEMIRDFWQIKADNLSEEIDLLEKRVSFNQWKILERITKTGHIASHTKESSRLMVDNDPQEAKNMLKLVELFIEGWYIERHKSEAIFETNSKTRLGKTTQLAGAR